MPLDENILIKKEEAKVYPPIPKDIYQAELLDITSEKRPTYDTRNKPDDEQVIETVLSFQFTILKGRDESQEKEENKDLRGRNIWANFVPASLYIGKKGKNKLYKIVEALLGRDLTLEEDATGITGKMLNELIGKQCRLSVEPQTKGEKTYDVIADLLKANETLTPLTEEEKDKARVKKDNKDGESNNEEKPTDNQDKEPEIDLEDIPF